MTLPDPRSTALKALAKLPQGLVERAIGKPPKVLQDQLDPEINLLLKLVALGPNGLESGSPGSRGARKRFTAANRLVAAHIDVGAVTDRTIEGPGGKIGLRFYTPIGLTEASAAVVYFHGGGFIRGNIDSHDSSCRMIAETAQVRVISVDYRLAPEHPFPAGLEDCTTAWRWVCENAESLNLRPEAIAVAGDSAGGNLAAVVSQEMVRSGDRVPAAQLLIYPVVDFVGTWPSRETFETGFLLTGEFMDMVDEAYLVGHEDRSDPRISPLSGDLAGLPPTVVTTAGFDPLQDQGKAYVEALRAAGVATEHLHEPGLVHGYFNLTGFGTSAPSAIRRTIAAFQRSLI